MADAKNKIKEVYVRLKNINVTAMMETIYSRGMITIREKRIIEILPLESEKMEYLLDHVIIPSLEVGVTKKFKMLLEVMEESEDQTTQILVRQIGTLKVH